MQRVLAPSSQLERQLQGSRQVPNATIPQTGSDGGVGADGLNSTVTGQPGLQIHPRVSVWFRTAFTPEKTWFFLQGRTSSEETA